MSPRTGGGWVADPTVSWTILLTARLAEPPPVPTLKTRARALADELGWPTPPTLRDLGDTGITGDTGAVDRLRHELGDAGIDTPLRLGLAGDRLVVAAHHAHVDGIGLLAVLGRLLATPVHSSARGLAQRPARSGLAAATATRLREAVLHPPARVLGTGPADEPDADVLAERPLNRSVRVAELIHAAVACLPGRLAREGPVSVAVGASRRGGDDPDVANRSALIRLTDVGSDDLDRFATRLRSTPVEADLSGSPHAAATRGAMTAGLRLLRHRLGSTLLVSHLGEVTAPGVTGLAFHPVSGGASGVALGAVGLAGRTSLTLRARGSTHTRSDLDALLDELADRLVRPR